MWMLPYGFARTTDTIREKNSILFKKGKNMLKSNSDVSGSTSLVCNAVFFVFREIENGFHDDRNESKNFSI